MVGAIHESPAKAINNRRTDFFGEAVNYLTYWNWTYFFFFANRYVIKTTMQQMNGET